MEKTSKIIINFTNGMPGEVTFDGTNSTDLVAAMASIRTLRNAAVDTIGVLLNLKEIDAVDLLNQIAVAATQYQVKKEAILKKNE